jgi:hypothetical protein
VVDVVAGSLKVNLGLFWGCCGLYSGPVGDSFGIWELDDGTLLGLFCVILDDWGFIS